METNPKLFNLGNQGCSRCHEQEKERNTLKTKMESRQKKTKHTEKEETLEKETDDGETKVTDFKGAIARQKKPSSEQEVQTVNLVEEKNGDIELRVRSEMKKKEEEYKKNIQEQDRTTERVKKQHTRKNEGNKSSEFEKVRIQRDQLSSRVTQLNEQINELQEENVKYGKFNHDCFLCLTFFIRELDNIYVFLFHN